MTDNILSTNDALIIENMITTAALISILKEKGLVSDETIKAEILKISKNFEQHLKDNFIKNNAITKTE